MGLSFVRWMSSFPRSKTNRACWSPRPAAPQIAWYLWCTIRARLTLANQRSLLNKELRRVVFLIICFKSQIDMLHPYLQSISTKFKALPSSKYLDFSSVVYTYIYIYIYILILQKRYQLLPDFGSCLRYETPHPSMRGGQHAVDEISVRELHWNSMYVGVTNLFSLISLWYYWNELDDLLLEYIFS